MIVLIIGGGGREHALAWKVAQAGRVTKVFVAPGNAGTALEDKVENVDLAADNISELLAFAQANAVDLAIVGPEAPLVLGIVDAFTAAGLKCFGPTKNAAQLEGSKAFSKDFLARHNIPTAAYGNFTDLSQALAYLKQQSIPVVVKADGLAAGKGVIVAQNLAAAEAAVRDMLAGNKFGDAGHCVVIEEFLRGEEASFICMVDGEHVLPLATSQDHKARDTGDQGPNTGGMGAYSPAPVVTAAIHQQILDAVIMPTVRGMASEGNPYTGFLYAGLMIDSDGLSRVLEFNCRCGDPETQPIMMRLKSDLTQLCEAALEGRLDSTKADWDARAALGVVLAARGYPENYTKGDVIHGLAEIESPDAKIFHAGTRRDGENIVTNGGRVLCAVGLGEDVGQAQTLAYSLADSISWDGMFCRRDIGYRAVQREND